MKSRSDERRRLLKIVGHCYARHIWAFDQKKCIYCGEDQFEIDHVPAVSWLYALGVSHFENNDIPVVTVPSCSRCNLWLSDKPYHTIRQRKGFIASKLRILFDKIQASPVWTDAEIEEMGPIFKKLLRNREDLRRYGLRRLEWASSSLPWDLERPISIERS